MYVCILMARGGKYTLHFELAGGIGKNYKFLSLNTHHGSNSSTAAVVVVVVRWYDILFMLVSFQKYMLRRIRFLAKH